MSSKGAQLWNCPWHHPKRRRCPHVPRVTSPGCAGPLLLACATLAEVPGSDWDTTAKGYSGLVSRWCQILPGTAAVPPSRRGHLPVSTAGAGLVCCHPGNFPCAHHGVQKSALGKVETQVIPPSPNCPTGNSAPHPPILKVPLTPPDFLED